MKWFRLAVDGQVERRSGLEIDHERSNVVGRIDRQVAGLPVYGIRSTWLAVRTNISLILASGKLLALQKAYISIRAAPAE